MGSIPSKSICLLLPCVRGSIVALDLMSIGVASRHGVALQLAMDSVSPAQLETHCGSPMSDACAGRTFQKATISSVVSALCLQENTFKALRALHQPISQALNICFCGDKLRRRESRRSWQDRLLHADGVSCRSQQHGTRQSFPEVLGHKEFGTVAQFVLCRHCAVERVCVSDICCRLSRVFDYTTT